MAVDEQLARSGVRRALGVIAPFATHGVGSLPHRDADAAAAFSIDAFDVVTLPSLPRRSPSEATIAQVLVGTPGVALGQYGALAVDLSRLDPDAPVDTDVRRDNFSGFRTTLELASARSHTGPVKWQLVGPISVGQALRRAGARPDVAFRTAAHVVESHLRALHDAVAAALPQSPQLVVIDEPFLDDVMASDFPIAPDEAIDLLSSAMAVVEHSASVGVHSCGDIDVATLIAAGPRLLSFPVSDAVLPYAGYLDRFVRDGGWIAWGVIATEGPIAVSSQRATRRLSKLWDELADRGCDIAALRAHSLVTPQCGLGGHSTTVAEAVCSAAREVSAAMLRR